MIRLQYSSVKEITSDPGFNEVLDAYSEEARVPGMPYPMIDYDMYEGMDASGMLQVITAYHEDKLIGFVNVLTYRVVHYSAQITSTESLFVLPEYRKTGAGLKLLREAEKLAISKGSVALLVGCPRGGPLSAVLHNSKSWQCTNEVHIKSLPCKM